MTVIAPKGKVTPAGLLPRMKRFTVVGIFEIDMYEYDSGIALVHIDDARKLLNLKNQISGIRLKLNDVEQARRVRWEISRSLDDRFLVRDWTQEHANFFRALEIEKRVVFIILLLIIAVAAFNIVSTLVMIVTDKQSDVAILRDAGNESGQCHESIYGAGVNHWSCRHHHWRNRGRDNGAQRGNPDSCAGNFFQHRAVSVGRLRDKQFSRPDEMGRCVADYRRCIGNELPGNNIPGLARIPSRASGGITL